MECFEGAALDFFWIVPRDFTKSCLTLAHVKNPTIRDVAPTALAGTQGAACAAAMAQKAKAEAEPPGDHLS